MTREYIHEFHAIALGLGRNDVALDYVLYGMTPDNLASGGTL